MYLSLFTAAYAIISRLKNQELNNLVVSSNSIALDKDDLFNVKVRLHGIVNKYDVKKVRVQHTLVDIFREVVKQPTKMGKLIIFGYNILIFFI